MRRKWREEDVYVPLDKGSLFLMPIEKPKDFALHHVGTSKEGCFLNRGTHALAREKNLRGKGPPETSVGLMREAFSSGPTKLRGPLKNANKIQEEEAQLLDLVNIKIQANLTQFKSQGETNKLGEPAREEINSQPCESKKEMTGKGNIVILAPDATQMEETSMTIIH